MFLYNTGLSMETMRYRRVTPGKIIFQIIGRYETLGYNEIFIFKLIFFYPVLQFHSTVSHIRDRVTCDRVTFTTFYFRDPS